MKLKARGMLARALSYDILGSYTFGFLRTAELVLTVMQCNLYRYNPPIRSRL